MHGLYLRTLLLQSRMQADSVILPIFKCSSDHTNFKFIVRMVLIALQRPVEELNSRPTIEDPQEKCLGKISN